jgi:hypothetical protein
MEHEIHPGGELSLAYGKLRGKQFLYLIDEHQTPPTPPMNHPSCLSSSKRLISRTWGMTHRRDEAQALNAQSSTGFDLTHKVESLENAKSKGSKQALPTPGE